MSLPDCRITSMQLALDCIALGAHKRTVMWITGFPRYGRLLKHLFPAQLGRPPYNNNVFSRAPGALRLSFGSFAAKYRTLRERGFLPSAALIAAFKHQQTLSSANTFSFDEAFALVCQLDGIWACSERSLQLVRCGACGTKHLCELGALPLRECVFCSAGRHPPPSRRKARTTRPSASRDYLPGVRLKDELQRLGAAREVIQLLLGQKDPPAGRKHYVSGRRPLRLDRWNVSCSVAMRARLSVAASTFKRLMRLGCPPDMAVVEAYKKARTVLPDADAFSFNLCFEVLSRFDARWGAEHHELSLASCCNCRGAVLIGSRPDHEFICPFCCLSDRLLERLLAASFEAKPAQTAPLFPELEPAVFRRVARSAAA